VAVDGSNWLLAVGSAMGPLGLDPAVMARMVCDIQPEGVVRILDPKTGTPLLVRRLAEGEEVSTGDPEEAPTVAADRETSPPRSIEAPLAVVATGSEFVDDLSDAEAAEAPRGPEVEPAGPPPALTMPEPSNRVDDVGSTIPDPAPEEPNLGFALRVPAVSGPAPRFSKADLDLFGLCTVLDLGDEHAPEDLAETLFMRGMDISVASDIPAAAAVTLDILLDTVEAESAAVLFGGINDPALRFIAARGPRASEVEEMTVPYGKGIAGFCHDTGMALIVHNVAVDPRHHGDVDSHTGYRTRAVLAVAIKDVDGGIHGCVELLNPPDRFQSWHMDAATTVASALADFVRMRIEV
jgi:hypothetical protein